MGRILVIDGSGSDLACLGDMLATRAMNNGWSGAVVFGAVRDTAVLSTLDFGIAALRTTAKRPFGHEPGTRGVTINTSGATIAPGDMIFVDQDAVLVLSADAAGK